MKCSVCGGAELEFCIKIVPYSFRGRKTLIEAKGDHCPACGEVVMDRKQSMAYMAKIKSFKSKVIAETIEPEYIIQVRKKLELT